MPRLREELPATLPDEDGPLVSIILATYEDEDIIEDAIKSVAEQTYTGIELVIVDGSEVGWLQELSETHNWVEYVHQEPLGVANAWNQGISKANGDIVSFLAADDRYTPEKTEKQVEKIQKGADIVYSDEFVITEEGSRNIIASIDLSGSEEPHVKFFKSGHGIPHLTVAGRRECFLDEKFDTSLEAREDPHLWVRLLRKYRAERIPEPLAYKHLRSDSLTSDPDMMYENEKRSVEDLVERFDELEKYKKERLRNVRYRYGKQLFHADRTGEARRVLLSLLTDGFLDYRVAAMFVISLLPFGNEAAFNSLQRLNERAKRAVR
jgi:glycosyltransferase involved in cell wall biosynthesis